MLVVVDMQEGAGLPGDEMGIEVMGGNADRVARVEGLLAAARGAGVPVVFFQEVHRPSGIDFGRELDGAEGPHCIEGARGTALEPSLRPREDEFHIVKRRYSGFIGTELEIVLRGLRASTLILVGGLTDVCVHYTFADAHQRDFYVRVVSDCVGGSSERSHAAALEAMEYLQTGAVRTSDEIVAAFNNLSLSHLEGASL
ncbi:cysteine hydrolase [Rhodococcus sp. X156]|uniref:cysteine hydrolase family protein n=1 Tax=Rhodococcus sp. X156 TaxID=2499145 RepID=UPI001F4965CB|nr:cysteine hydrolase [Rhodococcus sp. X156]